MDRACQILVVSSQAESSARRLHRLAIAAGCWILAHLVGGAALLPRHDTACRNDQLLLRCLLQLPLTLNMSANHLLPLSTASDAAVPGHVLLPIEFPAWSQSEPPCRRYNCYACTGSVLHPSAQEELAMQDRWLDWEASQLRPAALSGNAAAALTALDEALASSSGAYLAGSQLCLADVSLCAGTVDAPILSYISMVYIQGNRALTVHLHSQKWPRACWQQWRLLGSPHRGPPLPSRCESLRLHGGRLDVVPRPV